MFGGKKPKIYKVSNVKDYDSYESLRQDFMGDLDAMIKKSKSGDSINVVMQDFIFLGNIIAKRNKKLIKHTFLEDIENLINVFNQSLSGENEIFDKEKKDSQVLQQLSNLYYKLGEEGKGRVA